MPLKATSIVNCASYFLCYMLLSRAKREMLYVFASVTREMLYVFASVTHEMLYVCASVTNEMLYACVCALRCWTLC